MAMLPLLILGEADLVQTSVLIVGKKDTTRMRARNWPLRTRNANRMDGKLLAQFWFVACAQEGGADVEIFLNWNFRSFRPSTRAARIVLATYLIELLGTKIPVLPARYACLG